MTKTPKIAIVILNWNGKKLFPDFLPSIIQHSPGKNIEIIVADNGSTDGSLTFLRKNFPTVSLMDLKNNYGFAKGYNIALEKINADYFILVNSDVKVKEGWIEPCIEQLEQDHTIAAVQPKIRSYHEPKNFEYAGAAGGYIDKFGYPFCRGRILDKVEKDEKQYDKASEVFWASGACMFVRARIFKEAGGLDGDFWAHMEEIDLCWRLKNKGYKITYEPQSVVFHLGGGSLAYGNPQKVYLNFRNNLFMLFKNLPQKKFKRTLFIRMVLDGIAAIKFLAGLNIKAFTAVAKAHWAFYKSLALLRRKRQKLLQQVTASQHKQVFTKSIMWSFFWQKKHTFTDLDFNPEETCRN